ncbi:ABC transporter involved in cytochrome c biogenesis, CcmB subunit [Methanosarcina lacustris Z-7289]|uniref:Heme exporter protein B n=1 Tax=Methanosarcina lacustris Z-7289 TaxID=1434111 RepID=A0A0E3S1W1_9EURY|nr:heme exporter protein CcmB [Methanosarcina lacustris]AKB74081.1 ABC transporter involved in cytochrome c biogenesis, CcmB subunit [Methanosarcina lacustris Z-7289]
MIRSFYIAAKDLKAEFRTKQMLNSMFIFSLLVLVVFSISFGDFLGDTEKVEKLAPGVLWIAFTFAGMLGLSRTFVMETENGCLEALMLCPVDRGAIYTGKILSNLVIVFLMEAVTLPFFIILFNYSLGIGTLLLLLLILFLGTFGFIAVGTLLSALTLGTRTRELLLPVLLLPVLLPVLIPSVEATAGVLAGNSIGDLVPEIRLLAVYDLVFFVISHLVFEYVVSD